MQDHVGSRSGAQAPRADWLPTMSCRRLYLRLRAQGQAPRRAAFHDATSSERRWLGSQSHDVEEAVAAAVSEAALVTIRASMFHCLSTVVMVQRLG